MHPRLYLSMISPMSKTKKMKDPALKRRLNTERLYEAAAKAETALPQMVENLIAQFDDPELTVKEKVMILRAMQSTTRQKPRMEDAEGLLKRAQPNKGNPLLALGNVTVEKLLVLAPEQQEAALIQMLRGETPKVLEHKEE